MPLLINGERVDDRRFHRAFLAASGGIAPEALMRSDPTAFRSLQRAAERDVLQQVVALQMARATGLHVSEAEVEQERRKTWGTDAYLVCGAGVRANLHDALLLRKLEVYLARHVPRPGKAEVEAVYRQRLPEYAEPEQVHAVQMFLRVEGDTDREQAAAVLNAACAELNHGKPLSSIAACCGASFDDLGWIGTGLLVPELEGALAAMRPGEISPVIASIFGLHVLKMLARRSARTRPFAEVKDELARQIYDERRRDAIHRAVWSAMQQARIEEEDVSA